MKQQKITPRARQEILARYQAGEKQVVLAREYEVDKSYISRIVKNTKPETLDKSNLADTPPDALLNRYKACLLELRDCNQHLYDSLQDVQHLHLRIKTETERLQKVSDVGYRRSIERTIQSLKTQLTYASNSQRVGYQMVRLHREIAEILTELSRQKVMIPSKDSLI